MKVLVVEGYQETANMLSLQLEHRGYQIRLAPDGPSALLVAKFWQPDVVLLDLGLLGYEGYEVAHHLRNRVGLKRAKILVLCDLPPDVPKQKVHGIDGHCQKPVKLDVLKMLIEGLG